MGSARSQAGSIRVYRGLLFAYPAAFRDEYARELCLAFADRCRGTRSPGALATVWAEALLGILSEAPKEHLYMILHDLRYALRVLRKGGMASFLLGDLLKSQLFEITPTDPAAYLFGSALLLAVAMPASSLPARRATRMDPIVALRHE